MPIFYSSYLATFFQQLYSFEFWAVRHERCAISFYSDFDIRISQHYVNRGVGEFFNPRYV